MKVKSVAHLACYMFAAVGVAAEVTVDATSLRLNALEATVITLLGALTTLREDNNALREQLMVDNDAKEEAITNLKEELISIRSRRTTSTTSLDECIKVKVVGTKKKLVFKCKTDFKNPVRIANDVRITKGNLMITNGGNFTDLNGKGNLVIGASDVTQAGAHNIVIGDTHTFSSYGGLVVGEKNTISGPFSAVTGGYLNTASGQNSVVSGGNENVASGDAVVVSGGYGNEASGEGSVVSGGLYNIASGYYSAVNGGSDNEAYHVYSTVIGGRDNNATEPYSVVGQNP